MAPNQQIEALRVVLGKPRDQRSLKLMERWFKKNTQSWRRADEGDKAVVEFALNRPMTRQKLLQLTATFLTRWGFSRKSHCKENFQPMSMEQYLQGPTQEAPEASESKRQGEKCKRSQELEPSCERLAALFEKHAAPAMRECIKRVWKSAIVKDKEHKQATRPQKKRRLTESEDKWPGRLLIQIG